MSSTWTLSDSWVNGKYEKCLFLIPSRKLIVENAKRLILENQTKIIAEILNEDGTVLTEFDPLCINYGIPPREIQSPAIYINVLTKGNIVQSNIPFSKLTLKIYIIPGAHGDNYNDTYIVGLGYLSFLERLVRTMPMKELVYGWRGSTSFTQLPEIRLDETSDTGTIVTSVSESSVAETTMNLLLAYNQNN